MRSPENVGAVLASGALAGFGSSVCCIGQLLLASLGFGRVWISRLMILAGLLRPVFIVLAFVLLVVAFRRLYLAPPSSNPEDWDSRVRDRTRKDQRIAFWIVLPTMIGLIAAPWWMSLFDR